MVNMVSMADIAPQVDHAAVGSSLLSREINMPPPRWERVADAIRDMIRQDRGLVVGDDEVRRLPSYEQLRDALGPGRRVSISTVRSAIIALRAEGWLHDGESGISGVPVRDDHPE